MSKAEDRALKAYPKKMAEREGYDEYLRERKGFIRGYHQAEKDLELTWEDMKLIAEIEFAICYYEYKDKKLPPKEQFYKEILKRFKERKEK